MRKGLVIGLVLLFGAVGCDTEEDAVGAFTSSLSAEEATVQNLTFTQQSTFCEEFSSYSAAKGESLESQYGCFPLMGELASEATEASDPCAEADYVACDATVAEVEACAEEYTTFGYLSLATALSSAGDAAEEAEGAEGSEISIDLSILGGDCDAPAPTAISADCAAVAAKCPEVFGADGTEQPVVEGTEAAEEGGEAAEEGGEEAHEEGDEHDHEEGDEHDHEEGEEHEEEGGEATE